MAHFRAGHLLLPLRGSTTAGGGITGTVAVTLAAFTSTASGTVSAPGGGGTVAVTLGSFTATASGQTGPTGTAAVTLASFTATASGQVGQSGTVARTLASFTPSASGQVGQTGTVAVTLGNFVSTTGLVRYPNSVSSRKLLDQNGNPIQIRTISSWGLVQRLSNTNITARLEQAVARGFNAVTVVMDAGNNYGTGWTQFTNSSSSKTFYTGTAYQSTLGTAWDDHVTHLMNETARLGMFVLASLYGGFGSQGSSTQISAASNAQMQTTGSRWATFLATWNHWILHIGGDDTWGPGPTMGDRVDAFCQGIKSVKSGVIIVAEPGNGSTGFGQFPPASFTYFKLSLDSVYSYVSNSVEAEEVGWGNSTSPFWDCEPPYIGAAHYSGTASVERQNLRERHYAAPIEGAVGLNNGHEDWWPFGGAGLFTAGDTQTTAMNNVSIVEYQYGWTVWDLCNTTGWAPTSGFVTTGQGSGDTKAAQGTDGNTAVAYFPDNRTVVVDTTLLNGTGQVRLRWFDPTAGTFSTITAAEAQQTGRSVTLPAAHGDGTRDFVLVAELQPTGSVAVTLASFTPSASGTVSPPAITGTVAVALGSFTTSTAGNVGQVGTSSQTLAAFTSTAAGTFTPAPVTGTAAPTLGSFTATASATIGETGTVAVTLASFTTTTAGTVGQVGTVARTLNPFTSSASGTFAPSGSGFGTPTLNPFTSTATGTFTPAPVTGTVAVTLAAFTATASGTSTPPAFTGTSSRTLGSFIATATGTSGSGGLANPTLGQFTAIASGSSTPPAIIGTAAILLASFIARATTIPFVPSESRTWRIPASNRTWQIPASNRSYRPGR